MIKYISDLSESDQVALHVLKSERTISNPIYYLEDEGMMLRRWFISRTHKDSYVYITLWNKHAVRGEGVDDKTWIEMVSKAYLVQDIGALPYAHRN